VIFDAYEPPLPDRFLYYLAWEVMAGGPGDAEDLVQEARIKIWQLWQETQWVRTAAVKPASYYAKAAKNRMRAIYYRKTYSFGGTSHQGSADAMVHSPAALDAEDFIEPGIEIPFDLLDRIPGMLLAALVLQTAIDP
jgi:Sigma-70 region 2